MEKSGRYLLCYLSPTPPYSFLIPQGAWLPGDLCLPCSLATHIFVLGISDLSLLITTFMPVLCGHLSSSGFLGHIHAAQQKAGMGLGLRGCQPFSTWSQGTLLPCAFCSSGFWSATRRVGYLSQSWPDGRRLRCLAEQPLDGLSETHRVAYPGLQGMWLSRVSFVSLNPGPSNEQGKCILTTVRTYHPRALPGSCHLCGHWSMA
ncbi:uncharacterized protein [Alexandromys fortis]|uniref:uncharacterized protein isoform X1 n=1 Tax=Alexandromys fortis TaxID=100897 RepID=UPI0021531B33|nr:uncharacterized protein LOC126494005 isoform X1 [Microtus fortis]